MNKERIDNEHLESLEVFMKHHYLADNGHYQWVKKRFKELQQENKHLESILNEIIDWKDKNGNRYIYQDSLGEDWYFYDLDVFDELGEILDKVGDSND